MDDNRFKLFSRLGALLVILLFVALFLGRSVSFSFGDFFSANIGGGNNEKNQVVNDGQDEEPTEAPTKEPTEEPTLVPTEPGVMVEIVSPGEGETVGRELTVTGTWENVPDDLVVWVYVFSPAAGEYVLTIAERLDDGTWTAEVLAGSKGASNSGKGFEVGVVLVTQGAAQNIIENDGTLPVLPLGTQIYDEVLVTRE